MWRMIEWLGKAIAAALIVSFLSIWTTGYIVTSYIETVLKQYELPLEVQPMAMSGVWGKLWGAEQDRSVPDMITGETDPSPLADSGDAAEDKETESPVTTETGEGEGPKANSGKPEAEQSGGEADPSTGDETAQSESGNDNEEALPAWTEETMLTEEAMAEVKNQLSDEDKQFLFNMLMTKLPQEAWQRISTYVEQGLTEKELQEVQQLMAIHLNDDEYDQLMEILKKY
ncbi:hypothetical protein AB6A23_00210 [Paenibacillus tarimensis]